MLDLRRRVRMACDSIGLDVSCLPSAGWTILPVARIENLCHSCHDSFRASTKVCRMPADPFDTLREAVRQSPHNIPLRQHLAESLLERGRADEAEGEYRRALT